MTLTAPATQHPPKQPSNPVFSFVAQQVFALQNRYLENDPSARAKLARLRVSLTKEPGTVWEIVPFTVPPREDGAATSFARATEAERAAHTAMCLYGCLQQSIGKPMHVEGAGLGRACKALAAALRNEGDDRAEDRVWTKLGSAAQATSWSTFTHHLRSLIHLLNDRQIGLDIARLASDLYYWQFPKARTSVQRNWARQFHAYTSSKTTDQVTSSAPKSAASAE